MTSKPWALISFLFIFACAAGEAQRSRDKGAFRHGIIPQTTPSKREKIQAKMLEASVARGKALYSANCAECHGSEGLGDGEKARKLGMRPPSLKNLVKEVPNFKFFLSISQWSGQMPGWKDPYSEVDREDLVNYLKTFRGDSAQ